MHGLQRRKNRHAHKNFIMEKIKNVDTATQDTTEKKIELTSPKIAELNAKLDSLLDSVGATRDEKLQINLDIFTVQNEIKIEIAAEKRAEAERQIAEKRAEQAAHLDVYDNARIALDADNLTLAKLKQAERTTERLEQNNALNDAFKNARTIIVNALHRMPTGATVRQAATTNGEPKTGGTSDAIKTALDGYVAGGMNLTDAKKQCVADGFSRGTVGSVATKFYPVG